jgi:hypothetical protein
VFDRLVCDAGEELFAVSVSVICHPEAANVRLRLCALCWRPEVRLGTCDRTDGDELVVDLQADEVALIEDPVDDLVGSPASVGESGWNWSIPRSASHFFGTVAEVVYDLTLLLGVQLNHALRPTEGIPHSSLLLTCCSRPDRVG